MKRKKLVPLFLLAFLGCSKSEDRPATAASSPPIIQPPTAPVCITHLYNADGGLSSLASIDIFMPGFDTAKGDTVAVSYKRWDLVTWILSRPGFYADVSYIVNGSTAVLTSHVITQEDWALVATIKECM